jgi:hypothetical protein
MYSPVYCLSFTVYPLLFSEEKKMKEGLLWFDNDPQLKLADKIGRAASRYQVRFGRRPTVCYVNSEDFETQTEEINGIRLRPAVDIRRHHFWVGVEQETVTARAA